MTSGVLFHCQGIVGKNSFGQAPWQAEIRQRVATVDRVGMGMNSVHENSITAMIDINITVGLFKKIWPVSSGASCNIAEKGLYVIISMKIERGDASDACCEPKR